MMRLLAFALRTGLDIRPGELRTNGRAGVARSRSIVWPSRTDRRTSRPSTGGASTLRRDAGRRRSRHSCLNGGPSTIPLVRQAARRAATRGTLIPQEPLDVRDEVVARRQALLVVHRFEPLDVAACRLVQAGRRVEPGAQLA